METDFRTLTGKEIFGEYQKWCLNRSQGKLRNWYIFVEQVVIPSVIEAERK